MSIGWADGATDKEMGMTWLKQARVNRRYWLVWADGWADNSAASVWKLYR